MRYSASLQACHRSNPLREKSGSSQAADINPATGLSGNLLGEPLPVVGMRSAVRRRAMAGWTTGRSCMAPPDGHWRSQSPNLERHSRTNAGGTAPASRRARSQRISVGITLAQTTRAGCCEHPAQLSTPLTWGEKGLTNVNLSRLLCLFNHSTFFTRRARGQQQLAEHNQDFALEPEQGDGTATSLFRSRFGRAPEELSALGRQPGSTLLAESPDAFPPGCVSGFTSTTKERNRNV